jgi:hypothetical protein
VEVQADKPQAGASEVTLSFLAEAESDAAGISKLDVVLPDGIPPGAVSYLFRCASPNEQMTFRKVGPTSAAA